MIKIPIAKPLFGEEELRAVQRPLETGWVVQGPFVEEFEERFSAFTGAPFSVATSSCTSALHVALVALGVKPGDEVIVPAFTWVATANVVEYVGATPVFCDIDLSTFNIDARQAASLVTSRTVGIIPVHLFGLCADLDAIQAIADRHLLWVVEDAACAFGAAYHGRHAGTFGAAGCFSFHPRKSITTGEGGMLTTADERLARTAQSLRDHGATRSDLARHEDSGGFLLSDYPHVGFNYRLTDIQAALGCAQMDRAVAILERRRTIASRYGEILRDMAWLRTPIVPPGYTHGWQAYVCLFRPEPLSLSNVDRVSGFRNELMAALAREGIATRQGTHAPVLLEYYHNKYALRPEAFPNAVFADRLSLALPLYQQLTDEEQNAVASSLRTAAKAAAWWSGSIAESASGLRQYWEGRARQFDQPTAAAGYCLNGVPVGDDVLDAIAQDVREKLELGTDHSLLEVGSGPGLSAARLQHDVGRPYVLTDFSASMLRKLDPALRRRTSTFASEAACLPLVDACFDRVLCYSVFVEFPSQEYARRAVTELLRVTKAGGWVLIGDLQAPSGNTPKSGFRQWYTGEFFRSLDLPNTTVEVLPQEKEAKKRVNSRFDVRLKKIGKD